jgi:hypothetical protein
MELVARLYNIARQRGEVFAVNLDLSGWIACPLIVSQPYIRH